VQERVELAMPPPLEVRVTLVGLRVHARPVVGVVELVNAMVPVKPVCLVSVIVELPVELTSVLRLVGLAPMLKSVMS